MLVGALIILKFASSCLLRLTTVRCEREHKHIAGGVVAGRRQWYCSPCDKWFDFNQEYRKLHKQWHQLVADTFQSHPDLLEMDLYFDEWYVTL